MVIPTAVAVRFAVWFVLTLVVVAANDALIEPDGIVTLEGTEIEELSLERPTTNPDPVAVPLRFTRQESVPAPLIDVWLHVNPLKTGTPVPLRLIAAAPCEELFASVTDPVKEVELAA